jgi:hypothetical protein
MAINLSPTGKNIGYKGKKKTQDLGPGLVTGEDVGETSAATSQTGSVGQPGSQVGATGAGQTGSLIGGRPPAPGNVGEAEFDPATQALLGVLRVGSQMEDSTEKAINSIQESWDETLAKADAGPNQ